MSVTTIFLYIISSVILFILLEIINNKYHINKLNYIIISLIYIIIISGLFKEIKDNIFIIVIIELLIRIFYISNIEEHNFFKIHKDLLITYIILIISSYVLNINYINKVDSVFPNPNELKIIIWISIIYYLYSGIKNNINNNIDINKNIDKEKINRYKKEDIIIEYAKYKNKYYNIINTKYNELIQVIYSIIIYESNNRSKTLRKIDNLIFRINHKEKKLGIAGILSNKLITDEESIIILIAKLEELYNKISKKKNINNKQIELIKEYYTENYDNIINIYNEIIDFDNK